MSESPSAASSTADTKESSTASGAATPKEKFRLDYKVHPFQINTVELDFDLHEDFAFVQSRLQISRRPGSDSHADLVLDGEGLETLSVKVDRSEVPPDQLSIEPEKLTLTGLPSDFLLEIKVKIQPQLNTQLSGLYRTSGTFCTQCEAEGFRRITWFLDRPDIMSRFLVRIEAENASYPVLLSNGNLIESGNVVPVLEHEAGQKDRHYAIWQDPFPKPSYLFALVAGDLGHIQDRFTTCSGREVDLYVYSEHRNVEHLSHAMESLIKSMKWDEDVFGLEYDLDIYNIVAVEDFNMGAMENKSLNVFNTQYVLASQETATDSDFEGVESVIGHEYFHNWTGNRVTCRDWFQLTLKEGLTVFRDQQFSADLGSAGIQRIETVRALRGPQFAEDAGPMAHPIRPESYIAMDNFYTATVYQKGSEVIRMYHTLLGQSRFRKGMDLYFKRHDGCAVTCDDFRAAMADANHEDFGQFERWYLQAGTPVIEVEGNYNAAEKRYSLRMTQSCPSTPGQSEKLPFHIPIEVGLLDPNGDDLIGTQVLELKETEQEFHFEDIDAEPVPSVLRGFSAPVKLRMNRSFEDLAFLLGQDSDSFNRWEAGQTLASKVILDQVEAVAAGVPVALPVLLQEGFRKTLLDVSLDPSLRAYALVLPGEVTLGEEMEQIDPEALHLTRSGLRKALGQNLYEDFLKVHQSIKPDSEFSITTDAIGRRRLRNTCLAYLVASERPEAIQLCQSQFTDAGNMTDSLAALQCLLDHSIEVAQNALQQFEARWKDNSLVMDKWFSLQATASHAQVLDIVILLMDHPEFSMKNPNKVRSLLRSFASNPTGFHRKDGAGYAFLADRVLELDPINPQVASRLASALVRWRRYRAPWSTSMKAELQRILEQGKLSKDTFEMVTKSLA